MRKLNIPKSGKCYAILLVPLLGQQTELLAKAHAIVKPLTMKKTIGYLLLIILAVQSLFTGYSINNQFEFLYEYAFVSMPGVLASPKYLPNLSILQIVHWIFLVIAYICMVILPIIYYFRKSYKLVIYVPLFFLVSQFISLTIFSVVLIPFIVVWIITLILLKPDTSINKINRLPV